jgi:hypothetical protein
MKKVEYTYGRNDLFDYYILEEEKDAKEIEIDKNSLAYNFEGVKSYKISTYGQLPFGNHDFLLQIRKKGSEFSSGLILVCKEEIVSIVK